MTAEDILGLVLVGLVVAVLAVIGALLLRGKGAFFIAGYNTSSAAEKARYDEKALCRFVGKLCFIICAQMLLVVLGEVLRWGLIASIAGVSIPVVAIAAVIYANTGGRFLKK